MADDQVENKKEILNNNTDTISIIGRTELEDFKVYSDAKVTLRRVLVTLEWLGN